MKVEDKAIVRRWEQWRRANSDYPLARDNELKHLFALLAPQPGERIWEAGTGNGNLTLPLAAAVAPSGKVVTTDVQGENIAEVARVAAERELPITALLLPVEKPLLDPEHYTDRFDAVASIATLHHFDDRLEGGGERGRIAALRTFKEMLRPGGRLVLSDVLFDSLAQRYFDVIDNPEHAAPRGHPHDFFTKERLLEILTEVGFKDIQFELLSVPWTFSSPEEAAAFVHTLHNARVPQEESFAAAKRMLGFNKVGEYYELGWDLFYVTAYA